MSRNTHRSNWTRSYKIIELIILGFTLIFLSLTFGFTYVAHRDEKQAEQTQQENEELAQKISNKQQNLNEEANRRALESNKSQIRLSSRQMLLEERTEATADKIFPILINYDSDSQYLARKDKIRPYVDTNVLKSNLFQSDYKTKGNEGFVSAFGIHSKFEGISVATGLINSDGITAPVIIKVHYQSWEQGYRRSDNQDVYLGTYNLNEQKFTKLTWYQNIYQTIVAGS